MKKPRFSCIAFPSQMDVAVSTFARWNEAFIQFCSAPGRPIVALATGLLLVVSRALNWPALLIFYFYYFTVAWRWWQRCKTDKDPLPPGMPRFIGINGYGGSGKDTVGEILARKYGAKCHAFADALRTIASILNPIVEIKNGHKLRYNDALRVYGYERCKKELPNFRPFLVSLGKLCRDIVAPTVWIDTVLPEFDDEDPSTEPLRVYTDARHANECERVARRGGLVLRVSRPNVGPADEVEAKNVAEVKPMLTIVNDGTKQELEQAVLHGIKLWCALDRNNLPAEGITLQASSLRANLGVIEKK